MRERERQVFDSSSLQLLRTKRRLIFQKIFASSTKFLRDLRGKRCSKVKAVNLLNEYLWAILINSTSFIGPTIASFYSSFKDIRSKREIERERKRKGVTDNDNNKGFFVFIECLPHFLFFLLLSCNRHKNSHAQMNSREVPSASYLTFFLSLRILFLFLKSQPRSLLFLLFCLSCCIWHGTSVATFHAVTIHPSSSSWWLCDSSHSLALGHWLNPKSILFHSCNLYNCFLLSLFYSVFEARGKSISVVTAVQHFSRHLLHLFIWKDYLTTSFSI